MRWRRLGRIFVGDGQYPWMTSYASQPFAEHLDGDLYRIYFTSRDLQNRSYIGWLELDITRPDRILRLCEVPLLAPGKPGRFDDGGTMMSSLVRDGDTRHLYYIAWSLRTSVPYHLAIGLATGPRDAGDPRVSPLAGPIVERNPVDPLFCTAPFVLLENGVWRMWYVSGLGWPMDGGRLVPSYNTRYASSANGVDWERTGLVMLDPVEGEFGFSRPCVIRDRDGYEMWYAVRGRNRPYRLEYARSPDGLRWVRIPDAGLAPTADDWDSEMITYPHVFDHGGDRYMVYNGNGYGRTGFGLAVRA